LFGGTVLTKQIKAIANELPVMCKVIKPGQYYLLDDWTEEDVKASKE